MEDTDRESGKLSSKVILWLTIAGFATGHMALTAAGAWTLYNSAMQRMDAGFDRVDERFIRLESKMDAGFERVDERFIRLESKMDRGFESVNDRFDDVNGRIDDVNGRIDDVNGRIDEVQGNLSDVRERVARIEVVVNRFHPNEAGANP